MGTEPQDSYQANRFGGRRDGGGPNQNSVDNGELDTRPTEEAQHDEPVSSKLDCVLDRLDKFDVWKDETDCRFVNFDPSLSRETEPPSGFDEDDWEYEEGRRRRPGDRNQRYRNPNGGFRDGLLEERGAAILEGGMVQVGTRRVSAKGNISLVDLINLTIVLRRVGTRRNVTKSTPWEQISSKGLKWMRHGMMDLMHLIGYLVSNITSTT